MAYQAFLPVTTAYNKIRFRRAGLSESRPRVSPEFQDFHLLEVAENYEYPLHQHSNYELILVDRGPYCCELNREELVLENGQMLVVKPGDWHRDHLKRGQCHFVLHFRIQIGTEGGSEVSLFRDGVNPREQIASGQHGYNRALLDELKREAEGGAKFAGAVQDALLEGLFWRLVRSLPSKSLSMKLRQLPEEEREREALSAAFRKWIEKPAGVEDVARTLKVSSRQLAKRCRALFGDSPARILLRLKVQRAEELLVYHDLRVQEVSHLLGFSNPYHFSRVYRREQGVPPSKARGSNELGGRKAEPGA